MCCVASQNYLYTADWPLCNTIREYFWLAKSTCTLGYLKYRSLQFHFPSSALTFKSHYTRERALFFSYFKRPHAAIPLPGDTQPATDTILPLLTTALKFNAQTINKTSKVKSIISACVYFSYVHQRSFLLGRGTKIHPIAALKLTIAKSSH